MNGSKRDFTEPLINIGTMAEKLGVSGSSLRRYEQEGLIIPYRTSSGHRLYSQEDISRLKFIRYMIQHLGLNMEGIRRLQALLPCWKIHPCSLCKTVCSVHLSNCLPCWMQKSSTQDDELCRKCLVYRFGTQHLLSIKQLLYDEIDPRKLQQFMEKENHFPV